jgi:hypothetical protein
VLAVLTGEDYHAAGLKGIQQLAVPAEVIEYKIKAFGADSIRRRSRHRSTARRGVAAPRQKVCKTCR